MSYEREDKNNFLTIYLVDNREAILIYPKDVTEEDLTMIMEIIELLIK
jgi:hypothetical protein